MAWFETELASQVFFLTLAFQDNEQNGRLKVLTQWLYMVVFGIQPEFMVPWMMLDVRCIVFLKEKLLVASLLRS